MESQTAEKILQINKLEKRYQSGPKELHVLKDISFSVDAGQTISIIGPSGSGKTTLLGISAGLDLPSSGSVLIDGIPLESLDEDSRAALRNQKVGFVFQNFQLIPTLTALENVMAPLEIRGESGARSKAIELLAKVGLKQRLDHFPIQLSGGEQQRVALARAFINNPKLLFADEPTGNLDEETGSSIVDLLFNLNRDAGTTLVLVTHDHELAEKTDRILQIKSGVLIEKIR
ncbi:ABC transporter ATP-binding protein [Puniceicoccaceae bacterium K14]|nr:ABC transporter ATP-binding protein [Puniceicoccaceae bacterium K14]